MRKNAVYWWEEAPLAELERKAVPPATDIVIVGAGIRAWRRDPARACRTVRPGVGQAASRLYAQRRHHEREPAAGRAVVEDEKAEDQPGAASAQRPSWRSMISALRWVGGILRAWALSIKKHRSVGGDRRPQCNRASVPCSSSGPASSTH
jgi:hypothetical protein